MPPGLPLALLLILCHPACTSPESSGTSGGWRPIFDGSSLEDWAEVDFTQAGRVRLKNESIILEKGAPFTGVVYNRRDFPAIDYEISLTATRLEGDDFFCGLTLPYKDSHFSFIAGGWSGEVTGISNVDDADASQNETRTNISFALNQPYEIRVRTTSGRIQAWIDERQVVDLAVGDRKISLRPGEIGLCRPLGICSYFTKARIGKIYYRRLPD